MILYATLKKQLRKFEHQVSQFSTNRDWAIYMPNLYSHKSRLGIQKQSDNKFLVPGNQASWNPTFYEGSTMFLFYPFDFPLVMK
jgi:hypothetical protein